jgi:CTP synthase
VNNEYRERLAQGGFLFSGQSPDARLVEILELPGHPGFWAGSTQAEIATSLASPSFDHSRFMKA